jgi:hypothetical protein
MARKNVITPYPVQENEPCASVADYLGPYQPAWLASSGLAGPEQAERVTAPLADDVSAFLKRLTKGFALWLQPTSRVL